MEFEKRDQFRGRDPAYEPPDQLRAIPEVPELGCAISEGCGCRLQAARLQVAGGQVAGGRLLPGELGTMWLAALVLVTDLWGGLRRWRAEIAITPALTHSQNFRTASRFSR